MALATPCCLSILLQKQRKVAYAKWKIWLGRKNSKCQQYEGTSLFLLTNAPNGTENSKTKTSTFASILLHEANTLYFAVSKALSLFQI